MLFFILALIWEPPLQDALYSENESTIIDREAKPVANPFFQVFFVVEVLNLPIHPMLVGYSEMFI